MHIDSLETNLKDVWDSEFNDALPNGGMALLDSNFLRARFFEFAKKIEMVSGRETAISRAKAYVQILADIDFGISQGTRGSNNRTEYPKKALAAELEKPTALYLSDAEGRTDYLDWVLVNAFIGMECVSFERHLESRRMLPVEMKAAGLRFRERLAVRLNSKVSKTELSLLNELLKLAAAVDSPAYSARLVLDACLQAQRLGCFVHSCALAILDSYVQANRINVILPSGSRSPRFIERSFSTGK